MTQELPAQGGEQQESGPKNAKEFLAQWFKEKQDMGTTEQSISLKLVFFAEMLEEALNEDASLTAKQQSFVENRIISFVWNKDGKERPNPNDALQLATYINSCK